MGVAVDKQSREKSAVVAAVPQTCRHHAVTVVVVMTSSVTTFSVSTTEMYPRRLAMDRAVFPLYKTRGGSLQTDFYSVFNIPENRRTASAHFPLVPWSLRWAWRRAAAAR